MVLGPSSLSARGDGMGRNKKGGVKRVRRRGPAVSCLNIPLSPHLALPPPPLPSLLADGAQVPPRRREGRAQEETGLGDKNEKGKTNRRRLVFVTHKLRLQTFEKSETKQRKPHHPKGKHTHTQRASGRAGVRCGGGGGKKGSARPPPFTLKTKDGLALFFKPSVPFSQKKATPPPPPLSLFTPAPAAPSR